MFKINGKIWFANCDLHLTDEALSVQVRPEVTKVDVTEKVQDWLQKLHTDLRISD